jgi:16S rRNA C967 or C1407 C5-methylase (RsmB/RsmF family)/NOL1/NOP2/fmu family ribosome biogenesis protein
MQSLLGDEYEAFARALEAEQATSIRFNPLKTQHEPQGAERVAWTSTGYYLTERPAFTFDPLLHAGVYYVQEASSMFLEQVIRQYVAEPVRYLDLCAAPGGKTTLAIAALPEGSLVVGNEIERKRAHILAENVAKWGSASTVVSNRRADSFTPLTGFFDVILTDVPCSGEGMFRKDPRAVEEWSEANVEHCAARQHDILRDIWPALKPGGLLIYSTCTYNTEENEEMLAWICSELGATTLPVSVDPAWGIHAPLREGVNAYRFMPHTTRGEGLFMAVLRKADDGEADCDADRLVRDAAKKRAKRAGKGSQKGAAKEPTVPKEVTEWLLRPQEFRFEVEGDAVIAYPREHADEMLMLAEQLGPLSKGLAVARIKGKDWVPEHALALSTALRSDAFARAEVDRDTALAYLRREAVTLDADLPRGYVLVCFEGHPLGFVKHLGNRSNNLYPQEWRIRSSYSPEEEWTAFS